MSRRSTLTVPLTVPLAENSNTQRRRRSAHDWSITANTACSTDISRRPYIRGTSQSCPINLSSDEDEGEDDNDGTTPFARVRRRVQIREDASKQQPKSASPARAQQPATPARGRPQLHKEPVSDPGPDRAIQAAFQDKVIVYQQQLPCGKKGYASPMGEWSKKHRLKCQICEDQQSSQGEVRVSEDEGVSPSELRRSDRDSNIRNESNGHDGDSTDDRDNDYEKSENVREGVMVPEDQHASNLHNKLIRTAKEKLTPNEMSGYLYILRSPQNPGLLKLGYSVNPERRAKQHKAKCGLVINRVHISNCVVSMKRAERLAKLDMKHLQKDWDCSSCSRKHEEWFQVDEEKVKEVTKKWIKWINEQNPYTTSGEIKPMWVWLMDFERVPRHDFAENDHEARWAHWDEVLLSPSRRILRKFNGWEISKAVNRQSESKITPKKDSRPASREEQGAMVSQTPMNAEQASSQILDTGRNVAGNVYNYINTVNVRRDYVGNVPKICLSQK